MVTRLRSSAPHWRVAAALIGPFRIALEWDGDGPALRLSAEARWVFVVWRVRSRPGAPKPLQAATPTPPHPPSSGHAGRCLRAALLARGAVPGLARLVADEVRLLLPTVVDASLAVGLDDPASTSALYAAAHAVAGQAP
jgi:hypothetical protein